MTRNSRTAHCRATTHCQDTILHQNGGDATMDRHGDSATAAHGRGPRGRLRRLRLIALSAVALGVALSFGTAVASAAPVLELTAKPVPGKFVIGGSHKIDLTLRNAGDATIPGGSVTITETLPPELTATGYTSDLDFTFFSPNWTCNITNGGHLVTCTGPLAIGFGLSPGATTSLSIAVDVGDDVPDGAEITHQAEACGGGAAACAADSSAVPIQEENLRLTDSGGAMPGPRAWFAGTCDLSDADAVVAGTPADTPADPRDCLDFGSFAIFDNANRPSPWLSPPAWRLAPVADAGAHPDATAMFLFDVRAHEGVFDVSTGNPRNVLVDVPAGVIGNPNAVARCSLVEFAAGPHDCPPESQVGVSTIRLTQFFGATSVANNILPVYNLEPRKGYTAEFGIPDVARLANDTTGTSIRIFAKARTDGDFGITTGVMSIPTQFTLIGQSLTFWGVPWAASHDIWRPADSGTGIPPAGLAAPDQANYDPSWGAIKPFFTNPTECDGLQPVTKMTFDSYEQPAGFLDDGNPDPLDPAWTVAGSPAEPVENCAAPPFAPTLDLQPTSSAADSATGLSADLRLPPNDDPPAGIAANPDDVTGAPAHFDSTAGRATAQLDKAVVTLPEGVSINPSAAAGLEGCSDDQVGLVEQGNPPRFDNVDPTDGRGSPAEGTECPAGSRIGTVEARTPVLQETVTGDVVLGQPRASDIDCPDGGRRPECPLTTRVFLVLRNEERNLVAKVAGSSVSDATTGRLTATFDKNPRVPLESMHLEFKGGPRGLLATPPRCGGHAWSASFSPWTAAHGAGGAPVAGSDAFAIDTNCGFGFAPGLSAGMSSRQGGGNGALSFQLIRPDGQQWISRLTAQLPTGLLAKVKGVPLCSSAQAATGVCPAASRIGSVDAGAGAGAPFFLERKGDAYLTQGYRGCAYGMLVRVPVEAGPFRGALALSPIVVRQAICIDSSDASVDAVSDPLPEIWHGVPLRVRQITVEVDRPGFTLNPTDCAPKQIAAVLTSTAGANYTATDRFQAAGCAALPFKPKLAMRLTGKKQVKTGKHPGIKAKVTQTGIGEAGIEKAVVRLPKSLALDPDNAQALCEFEAGTRPDLENHCPRGSIVGRARAVSPLLERPLAGNVYFVKNVRIDPTSGNRIRTLPMIIVALRGEIAVNLRGESSTTKGGKLVNTFDKVPDAPITRFNLNITGGRNGILAVTRTRRARINLCAGRHVAEADMDGQNGRRHDFDVRMKTPCTRKQIRKAKRAAVKRAAARRG